METPYQVVKDATGWESVMAIRCKWCEGGPTVIGYRKGQADNDGATTDGICVGCKDRIFNEHMRGDHVKRPS